MTRAAAWPGAFAAAALVALLASPTALAEPVDASTTAPKLSEMAEELQRLQLRIGRGDRGAYPEVVQQLKAMAIAIAAAPADRWKDNREADSLVLYILSGGALTEVVPLLRSEALKESERPLARAAFAYITNHEADALELLRAVNLDALDARIAGQVAFARSLLETKRDPKTAVALLDRARLVAPGSLVEEAALRREILLLAESHDSERVALLTRQYVDRFPASLYATEFFRDLARWVARQGLADDPARYRRLADAAAALPPETRREFLLALARAAAVNGHFDAAASAATDALRDASPGGPEEARARLYQAAGRIFLPDQFEAAQADLKALAGAKLDRADAGLLVSVRNVASQLRTAPAAGVVEAQGDVVAKEEAGKAKSGAALTIDQAQAALQRTASLTESPQ